MNIYIYITQWVVQLSAKCKYFANTSFNIYSKHDKCLHFSKVDFLILSGQVYLKEDNAINAKSFCITFIFTYPLDITLKNHKLSLNIKHYIGRIWPLQNTSRD